MSDQVKKYLMFAAGVAINSFGISLITRSELGTSQISSVPYVLSLRFSSISFGLWSFLINLLFIVLQAVLLRKVFPKFQYLQVLVDILFSALIDVSMGILDFLHPEQLWIRLLCALAGCAVLGFGITVEVAPHVLMVPGEGIVAAITQVSGKRLGTVKVIFDVTLIAIAVVLSFLFFGELKGVGAGTVLSALTVGQFINFFNAHIRWRKLPFLKSKSR